MEWKKVKSTFFITWAPFLFHLFSSGMEENYNKIKILYKGVNYEKSVTILIIRFFLLYFEPISAFASTTAAKAQVIGILFTVVLALLGGLIVGNIIKLTGSKEKIYEDTDEFTEV